MPIDWADLMFTSKGRIWIWIWGKRECRRETVWVRWGREGPRRAREILEEAEMVDVEEESWERRCVAMWVLRGL